MKTNILGVQIDEISMNEAVEQVLGWLKQGGKHYIVTPNPEFIVAAQKDQEFKEVLNKADLAIPDSARLGWAKGVLEEKNPLLKFLKWKLFLFPGLFKFETVAGIDLMEKLVKESSEKGFTIGLLGGGKGVAERLGKLLGRKYPELKIVFIDSGGIIDQGGNQVTEDQMKSDEIRLNQKVSQTPISSDLSGLPGPTDILFVAFGHIKQEKWMAKNLSKYPVKVMMGVGGAFDYLSGEVPRAPEILRSLGLEWIFRLAVQPWRVKRFGALVEFILMVLFKK